MRRFGWISGWLLVLPLFAHDIITTRLTYTRDIAPILNKRCAACHDSASTIPLTSYKEVRPWAVAIKEQVLSRSMPPWGAVKGFGDLVPDDSLSEEEIMIVAAWVVGGAPAGKPGVSERKAAPRPNPGAELEDAILISTRHVLRSPLVVYGVRPRPNELVRSARITARYPGGHVEPLVWLYQYDPRLRRIFRFGAPLRLPRGTRIESNEPVQFFLESRATAPSPAR